MPRCKIRIKLNPPVEFERHADAVRQEFRNADLVDAPEKVDVVYGYGPSAEVSFDLAMEADANADLVKLAEILRTSDATRAEFLTVEFWLTAAERDAIEQGGTVAAYDRAYRHDTPEQQS